MFCDVRLSRTKSEKYFCRLFKFFWDFRFLQVILLLLYVIPAGLCKNFCLSDNGFTNVVPQAGEKAGKFTPHDIQGTMWNKKDLVSKCTDICCELDTCDAVYIIENSCFTLDCISEEACSPIEAEVQDTFMAFVSRAMPLESEGSDMWPRNLNDDDDDNDDKECNPKDPTTCGYNEECIRINGKKGRFQLQCQCIDGYQFDPTSDSCIGTLKPV
ncbi:uncharacterized protein LOC144444193 [Glandiceps talaboti]